ncbi:zinc finger protein 836-like [Anoplophora glabripennis]|uniref:zinc finger protein 836-like n=1 Tax=Anoplophora glabripennis TaxID=217634 RepID=UPI000C78FBBB|nr:zinc finger protein 836-like [Anoplophora glabripennis]
MCSTCSAKLYSAFNFKSTCLYVEQKIVSYVKPNMSFVDLREVYLYKNENKPSVKIEDDQKICRLCLQLTNEEFVPFCDIMLEVIHRCISEVNFGITEDPVVCRQCFDSLNIHNTFIRTCLDVETQIHDIFDDKITDFKRSDIFIRNEYDEIGLGVEQTMEGSIKTEEEIGTEETLIEIKEVDIKSEVNDLESDPSSYDLHNETIENKTMHNYKDVGEIKKEYMSETVEVQISKSERKDEFDSSVNQEAVPELIHDKESPTCRQLINNDRFEEPVYRCKTCNFETKFKGGLSVHQLSHKDPLDIEIYTCDTCTYETKYKADLKRHQLSHKDPSEIEMYKCDMCKYETKYKQNIKKHQLVHKDSPEIELYKCETCIYETRYKCRLKDHQLLHKDPFEIQMYKCEVCDYVTRYKNHLKRHQLSHKNPSEIQMYKCDMCSFKTKYERHLKSHQLIHKYASEIQKYRCGACTYETKRKHCLKNHQLTHKDPSEIQMYKCDICRYETKYKYNIKKHQLIHKKISTE